MKYLKDFIASSLPGIGYVTISGSAFESQIATVGIFNLLLHEEQEHREERPEQPQHRANAAFLQLPKKHVQVFQSHGLIQDALSWYIFPTRRCLFVVLNL